MRIELTGAPLLVAVFSFGLACSGTVRTIEQEPEAADGTGGQDAGGTGGTPDDPTGSGGEESEPYVEPDCPPEPPPPKFKECDPIGPPTDCPLGYGCYPYLNYPYGEGCGYASTGALCLLAGDLEQGEFCGEEEGYCAPGYLCVVGAAGGKRCGKICEPVANHGCPDGLICGETDIAGYGVCF